jgi:hypothetical protein
MFGFQQLCAWHAQLMPYLIASTQLHESMESVGHGTSGCSRGGVMY